VGYTTHSHRSYSTKWDNEETTRNRVTKHTNKKTSKQIKAITSTDNRLQKTPIKKNNKQNKRTKNASRGFEPIIYRGVLLNTILHAILYVVYRIC
jgi:hypothetical protein